LLALPLLLLLLRWLLLHSASLAFMLLLPLLPPRLVPLPDPFITCSASVSTADARPFPLTSLLLLLLLLIVLVLVPAVVALAAAAAPDLASVCPPLPVPVVRPLPPSESGKHERQRGKETRRSSDGRRISSSRDNTMSTATSEVQPIAFDSTAQLDAVLDRIRLQLQYHVDSACRGREDDPAFKTELQAIMERVRASLHLRIALHCIALHCSALHNAATAHNDARLHLH
jgi:hypothetical protein